MAGAEDDRKRCKSHLWFSINKRYTKHTDCRLRVISAPCGHDLS